MALREEPRHRPPRLNLDKTSPHAYEHSGDSAYSHGKDSAQISPEYRTPKDIANDVLIQCVSPRLPAFMNDVLLKSKSIEAEQRKIIARRMAHKREDDEPDRSGDDDYDDMPGSGQPKRTTLLMPGRHSAPNSASGPLSGVQTPSSLRQLNRAPRPSNIKIHPPAAAMASGKFTDPLSAPLPVYYTSPPYSSRISPPRVRPATSSGGGIRSTSMSLPTPTARVMSAIDPSARVRAEMAARQAELAKEDEDDEDEDEEDDDRDPEDAALSDSEADRPPPSAKRARRSLSEDSPSQAKRARFLDLCGQIWDLLQS